MASHGTPRGDDVFVHSGDVYNGGPGDDTITIGVTFDEHFSLDRATVSGGPGDDTIIQLTDVPAYVYPATISGGPGDDTIVAGTGLTSEPTVYTGGPGHDLFEFSVIRPTSYDYNISDFSRHDAIQLPGAYSNVTFTDHGDYTELRALSPAGNEGLFIHLDGRFDESQFHVADDGQGHDIVTYGAHSDWMLS